MASVCEFFLRDANPVKSSNCSAIPLTFGHVVKRDVSIRAANGLRQALLAPRTYPLGSVCEPEGTAYRHIIWVTRSLKCLTLRTTVGIIVIATAAI